MIRAAKKTLCIGLCVLLALVQAGCGTDSSQKAVSSRDTAADAVYAAGTDYRPAAAETVYVYVTDTGTKYHRESCQYLRLSKHKITLDDARDEGYTPCSICDP